MDDVYNIAVNSEDPKYDLGFLHSDLDTFQFPALCEELDHEQFLALDDDQSFYLAFPDTGVFATGDETVSAGSSEVTPLSDSSTRTLSTRTISPTSDILTFQDKPTAQDIEAMYHDTTQSIISGRQSRAGSASWSSTDHSLAGLNSTLTPPARLIPNSSRSFSYLAQQVSQLESSTPPPPSSFFPSPRTQHQTTPGRSPFLSSNIHSTHIPQLPQLSSENAFIHATMAPESSSYYVQTLTPQQLQHQFQHQMQLQQQPLSILQPQPSRQIFQNHLSPLFPNQLPTQATSQTYPLQIYNTTTTTSLSDSLPNLTATAPTPILPHTTGNSSAGYQCFSHGCGGRHFSNWGNLVRHHRERQLRSKAGAKPICQRCGKGFTRSSARDAHVAGLKCVLGRRRRGGTAGSSATASTSRAGSVTGNNDGVRASLSDTETEMGKHSRRGSAVEDQDHDQDYENGSEGSRDGRVEGEGEDEIEMIGEEQQQQQQQQQRCLNDEHALSSDAFGLGFSDAGPSYLAPQQLRFEH